MQQSIRVVNNKVTHNKNNKTGFNFILKKK